MPQRDRDSERNRGTSPQPRAVGVPANDSYDNPASYLVTATHVVLKARQSGPVLVKCNTNGGITETVKIDSEWLYHDDEGVDLAALPLQPREGDDPVAYSYLPVTMFGMGGFAGRPSVGDDLLIAGTFTHGLGELRNLPIVRAGIFSAMPGESSQDATSGKPHSGYLVENRSFGGLGGTPMLAPRSEFSTTVGGHTSHSLMGIILGHLNDVSPLSIEAGNAMAQLVATNTGIAIVTPIKALHDHLFNTDVKRAREERRQ